MPDWIDANPGTWPSAVWGIASPASPRLPSTRGGHAPERAGFLVLRYGSAIAPGTRNDEDRANALDLQRSGRHRGGRGCTEAGRAPPLEAMERARSRRPRRGGRRGRLPSSGGSRDTAAVRTAAVERGAITASVSATGNLNAVIMVTQPASAGKGHRRRRMKSRAPSTRSWGTPERGPMAARPRLSR